MTYEKATTLPIHRVVELATKRYNKDMGNHLLNLYDFLKAKYNKYVELIGGAIGAGACAAVKRGDKVYTIADDVPLLHFLTGRCCTYMTFMKFQLSCKICEMEMVVMYECVVW